MVDGEGALEPFSGDVPSVPEAPDVVDQHIEGRVSLQHLCRQPPHFRLGGQVGHERVHLPSAGCADLTRTSFSYGQDHGW